MLSQPSTSPTRRLLYVSNGTGVTGVFNGQVDGDFGGLGVDQIVQLLLELYEVRVEVGRHFVESWPALVKQLCAPFQTTALGVFGHSFGGAAILGVADAIPDTRKVVSALNLDGQLFGDPASNVSSVADIKRPVLMLGQTNHALNDPTWATFSAAQTDWWRILYVAGADHVDFTDVAFWRAFEGSAEKRQLNYRPDANGKCDKRIRHQLLQPDNARSRGDCTQSAWGRVA